MAVMIVMETQRKHILAMKDTVEWTVAGEHGVNGRHVRLPVAKAQQDDPVNVPIPRHLMEDTAVVVIQIRSWIVMWRLAYPI